MIMIHQERRACDHTHLAGLVWSEMCDRCIENSAGTVVAIEADSTIPYKSILRQSYKERNVPITIVFS